MENNNKFLNVKAVCKKYNIKLRKWYGTKKTIIEILKDLSKKWVSLNEDSKKEISQSFAGLRKGKNHEFKYLMDEMTSK